MSNSLFSEVVLLRYDLKDSDEIKLLSEFKNNSSFLNIKPYDPNEEVSHLILAVLITTNSAHLRNKKFLKISIGHKVGFDLNLNDFSDLKNLEIFLRPFILEKKLKLIYELEKKSSVRLNVLLNKVKQNIESLGQADDIQKLFMLSQKLLSFQQDVINSFDESKINKTIQNFVQEAKLNFSAKLVRFEINQNTIDDAYTYFLPEIADNIYSLRVNFHKNDFYELTSFYFLYCSILNCFIFKKSKDDPFDDENIWREMIDLIPFPIALLSAEGEIRQHNSLFLKLGFSPRSCLDLRPRDKILINEIPYNIFRKEITHLDENKFLIVFFTESFFLKNDLNHLPNAQELGIVSSSIAHELNNPIAGVQAALSYLLLEENLNFETKEILTEMKSGASRCKQLIETFLGFSRVNISTSDLVSSNIEVCYQQAQNLLRFRTVESGIRINLDFIRYSNFKNSINPSLLTMTFYLIFGELMTMFSHHQLVWNDNQKDKIIKGELVESSQEIILNFSDFKVSEFVISKLIQNLLNIEDLVLQISDYSFRFISPKIKNDL